MRGVVASAFAIAFAVGGWSMGCGADDAPAEPIASPVDGGADARTTSSFDDPQPTPPPHDARRVECTPGVVPNGAEDLSQRYRGLCSPTCEHGQFCVSWGDTDIADFDLDAGDVKAHTFEIAPLLCEGCHALSACDSGDLCTCLLGQLPKEPCGYEGGLQCRVLEGRLQLRCLAITLL